MMLPNPVPATAAEAAEMLAAQCMTEARPATSRACDDLEYIAARLNEAESLEAFHTEPLPPGFVVIFTIDARRRTLYSLRVPPGVDDEPRLCTEDVRVVLADAWNRHYTRWPDGVTPEALDRLVQAPPVPTCLVRRAFWDLALHHAAYSAALHAANSVAADDSRSEVARDAALAVITEVQVTSGTLEALRMARLAHLTGAWVDEDGMRATTMFHQDPHVVMPWAALFSRYMNLAHPEAGSWWEETCASSAFVPASAKEAEQQMAFAVGRAWAATFMIAMACAGELMRSPSPRPELSDLVLREAVHAATRIVGLRLTPQPAVGRHSMMPWARRVLRRGSPRLFEILDGQFERLGVEGRPPARA